MRSSTVTAQQQLWFLAMSSVKKYFILCLVSLSGLLHERLNSKIENAENIMLQILFSFLHSLVNSSHPAPCKLFCLIKIFCSYFHPQANNIERWEMKLCKKAKLRVFRPFILRLEHHICSLSYMLTTTHATILWGNLIFNVIYLDLPGRNWNFSSVALMIFTVSVSCAVKRYV